MNRRIWFCLAASLLAFLAFGGMGETANAAIPGQEVNSIGGAALTESRPYGPSWPTATAVSTAVTTTEPLVTRTPTGLPVATPYPPANSCARYLIIPSTRASIVPGNYDTGNHCDRCRTTITVPFHYRMYKLDFETGKVVTPVAPNGHGYITMDGSSDGTLTCDIEVDPPNPGNNVCLPSQNSNSTIFPHWDDLDTGTTNCSTCGIFTSVSGSPPNQIFNIEWRAVYSGTDDFVNFEARLYENPFPYLSKFDVIYGAVPQLGAGATTGVQGNYTSWQFTQYSCNTGNLYPGLMLTYVLVNGNSPSADCRRPVPRPKASVEPVATDVPGK